MKLNENGDFCLLYVEPADEKQTILETIGTQTRPVVLMLPLAAGQTRSKLFQRPEDFRDLKYVKRQSGTPVIFVTAGSELLSQMAARYGFPAYASIDVFAEVLASGRKAEYDSGVHVHHTRTGPLVPSAAQLAAMQRAMPSNSNLQLAAIQQSAPLGALEGEQQEELSEIGSEVVPATTRYSSARSLNAPTDLAFWPGLHNRSIPEPATPFPAGPLDEYSRHIQALSVEEDTPPSSISAIQSERSRRSAARSTSEYYAGIQQTSGEADEQVYELPTRPIHPSRASVQQSRGEGQPRRTVDLSTQSASAPRRTRSAPDLPAHTSMPPVRSTMRPAPVTPLVRPPEPEPPRSRHGASPLFILLLLFILGGAGLGSLIVITHNAPPPAAVAQPVGTVSFLSSEQLNQNTSQGIDDEVQISLHGLGEPVQGKSYYAWLLGDKSQPESQTIPLGALNVSRGIASLLYRGDSQHTNLLRTASRFLVTEESSGATPMIPSPDTTTWKYVGEIAATPDPNTNPHYSFLDHLRHLLADEPTLDSMELQGGLNNWFTQNIAELVQWTSNARDQWQSNNFIAVRNQGIRILSYLDGMSFLAQDIPAASIKANPTLNTRLAGLGLLNIRGLDQNPPSYMDQLAFHLNGLINSPGSPANIRSIAAKIQPVLNYLNSWLKTLRSDDRQLLSMNDDQISQQQAFSILDDMVLQSSNIYSGSTDPATGQFKQGVSWVHQELQALATINISTYIANSSLPDLGPSSGQSSSTSLLPWLAEWKRAVEGWL